MITSTPGADTAPSDPRPASFGTPAASAVLGIAAVIGLDDKSMIAAFRRRGLSDAQIGHMIGASRTAVYRAGRGLHGLRARAHAALQIAYLSLPVPGKGAADNASNNQQPAD